MNITNCKTYVSEPRNRRINLFLACAVSNFLLGAAPISSCQAQSAAQAPVSEPAAKSTIPAAATPAIDATTLLLKDIEASTTRDRTISDDDLAFVLQFAQTPGVDQVAAFRAIAPLEYLWTKRISDAQYAAIHNYVMRTLLVDDKVTDPSGLQKAACLGLLFHYSREKAMRPIVENLKNDSRPSVNKAAVTLSDNRWWEKL